jgi:tyrosyl-tRNA synthetase
LLDKNDNSAEQQLNQLTKNCVDLLPTDQLLKQIQNNKKLTIKLGIDPTAPDIHLGHYVVLKTLRTFQDQGHKVVLIIGDATAKIGDPSGRSKTRPLLTDQQIKENSLTFQEQAFKILDSNPEKVSVQYNSNWLDMTGNQLIELISRATVAQLIERDDFSKRLNNNQPIALSELIYPVLQAYDSVHIKADLEVGGTDQKFNLLLGRQLQAKLDPERLGQSVLTMPILPGIDGQQKMSKSLNNFIAVNDPPGEVYGKTMSIPDQAMEQYYRLILDQQPNPNKSAYQNKRQLAKQLTELLHDPEQAEQAEQQFIHKHVKKETNKVNAQEVKLNSSWKSADNNDYHLPAIISQQFSITKSEARRLLKANAVKLDNQVINQLNLPEQDLTSKLLTVGKHRSCRLVS